MTPLRRLGAAGLLSEVGDWLLLIALPLFVLDLTGSAFVTATVFALELVPTLLASPVAGALADRFDRWRLMTSAAFFQAIALLPLLAVHDAGDVWIVYAVVIAQATLGTVVEPCRAATAAALAAPGDRLRMNSGLATLSGVARLVGGPLGGIVFAAGGLEAVVAADAASFLLAAAILAPGGPRPATERLAATLSSSAREGLRIVAHTPALRRLLTVTALMAFAQGAFVVLFVLFVTRQLHHGDAAVGLLRGIQAVGALAGGLVLTAVVRRADPHRLLALSLAAFAACSLAIWNLPHLTTALAPYVVLFVVVGAPGLAAFTSLVTLLQDASPEDARGRTMSTFLAVDGGVQAAGMLGAGVVAAGVGLTAALEVQGLVYVSAAVLAAWPRSMPTGATGLEPATPA